MVDNSWKSKIELKLVVSSFLIDKVIGRRHYAVCEMLVDVVGKKEKWRSANNKGWPSTPRVPSSLKWRSTDEASMEHVMLHSAGPKISIYSSRDRLPTPLGHKLDHGPAQLWKHYAHLNRNGIDFVASRQVRMSQASITAPLSHRIDLPQEY